ncbi:Adhesion G Protein-Coupled Receptor B2 [Manis pentadactyla]|nr:Adhesion G Protein-Coupled Receptor B2 [Manis pentadactyla]
MRRYVVANLFLLEENNSGTSGHEERTGEEVHPCSLSRFFEMSGAYIIEWMNQEPLWHTGSMVDKAAQPVMMQGR